MFLFCDKHLQKSLLNDSGPFPALEFKYSMTKDPLTMC